MVLCHYYTTSVHGPILELWRAPARLLKMARASAPTGLLAKKWARSRRNQKYGIKLPAILLEQNIWYNMSQDSYRNVCFTVNNYTDDDIERIKSVGWKYLVIGKETAPTTGTKHLQGYGLLLNRTRLKTLRSKFGCPSLHFEERRGTHKQARDYCKKDGDFIEIGDEPQQGKRTDLEEIAEKIKEGATLKDIAIEHPATYIRNYRGISNYKALMTQDYTPSDVRGVWYVGPPGAGKSRKARDENPNAYLKPQNKWWDGYAGESVVIFDDLDKGAIGLGHHLKIWTDRYACSGEIKGGTVKLQHDKFIVTSNYTIDDLWGDDEEMCKALKRRFKVTHFRVI